MKPSAQAMAVSIGMADKGLRSNGRWKRGSVPAPAGDITDVSNMTRQSWSNMINQCGVILDWRPDLADGVLRGEPLEPAYQAATAERERDVDAVDEALRG